MARNFERHALGGPRKHLLEGRADDPNQVAIVLTTQIRLDGTAVLVCRLYNHLTSPDLILSVSAPTFTINAPSSSMFSAMPV